ncbi:hypothetical protein DH86_00003494 [Scytalidium sp. 3C]|nr:hypothetical protein DH86_00003494 [Scytalidium sp. 3C]
MSDSEAGSRAASPAAEERLSEDPPVDSVPANPDQDDDDDLDNDSELSEVDEAEFADFDPKTVALEDRPAIDIDEDVARTLKAAKRKRSEKDGAAKKPKEGKREKKKRSRRDDDEAADGDTVEGKRSRKPKSTRTDEERDRAKERRKATPEPENEENLTPEERRRRALDRAMDAALKNPNKRRRKKDEVDLEEALDDEIADLKIRMEAACQADNVARDKGEPAIHKLKLLPEVVALLNRNTSQHSVVDPDTNFLQSVRFFLEPLNDGSLPAYNIQRDIFQALTRLPIEKECLKSSGIGKVVLYYTKSKRPEMQIKRIAERLLGEWSRPILRRSDDYKKRKVITKDFDHQAAQLALRFSQSQPSLSQHAPSHSQRDLERQRILAQPIRSNRARMESSDTSYTVAPRSTFDPNKALDPASRPIGAGGMEAFRRMTAKQGRKRA